ncbi:hypothetical protein EF879_03640 [Micromonospora sp. HM5-17]|nr:hypothetical protein EF879_03640 [Micromonospora sp. HM5-17]
MSMLDLPYSTAPGAAVLAVPTWLATTPLAGARPRPALGSPPPARPRLTANQSPARNTATANQSPAWNAATGHHAGRAGRLTPAQISRAGAGR